MANNKKTLYWAIKLDSKDIINNKLIKKSLDDNKLLVPLVHMHSTLLYVGRKENENEKVFDILRGKEVRVYVKKYAMSDKSLALKVDRLKYVEDELRNVEVVSFASEQHVTVALVKGEKAMDSVKSFSEGVFIEYEDEMVLMGKIWQFFY
jgi:hypothetical protein